MTYDERCRVAVLTRIAQKMKFSKSFLPPPLPPEKLYPENCPPLLQRKTK